MIMLEPGMEIFANRNLFGRKNFLKGEIAVIEKFMGNIIYVRCGEEIDGWGSTVFSLTKDGPPIEEFTFRKQPVKMRVVRD